MTNTSYLDDLQAPFEAFTTTAGAEGFEFDVLVTPEDYWDYHDALWPFIEYRAEVMFTLHPQVDQEFMRLVVDCRSRTQGEFVAIALQRVYDRLKPTA